MEACIFVYVHLTWNMCNILDSCVHRMFLPVVDVRTDDNSEYIDHVEAQVA